MDMHMVLLRSVICYVPWEYLCMCDRTFSLLDMTWDTWNQANILSPAHTYCDAIICYAMPLMCVMWNHVTLNHIFLWGCSHLTWNYQCIPKYAHTCAPECFGVPKAVFLSFPHKLTVCYALWWCRIRQHVLWNLTMKRLIEVCKYLCLYDMVTEGCGDVTIKDSCLDDIFKTF